jgi:hypothetical protein
MAYRTLWYNQRTKLIATKHGAKTSTGRASKNCRHSVCGPSPIVITTSIVKTYEYKFLFKNVWHWLFDLCSVHVPITAVLFRAVELPCNANWHSAEFLTDSILSNVAHILLITRNRYHPADLFRMDILYYRTSWGSPQCGKIYCWWALAYIFQDIINTEEKSSWHDYIMKILCFYITLHLNPNVSQGWGSGLEDFMDSESGSRKWRQEMK